MSGGSHKKADAHGASAAHGGSGSHGSSSKAAAPGDFRMWVFLLVVAASCIWFFWPRLSATIEKLRTSKNSEQQSNETGKSASRQTAPPDGPAEAKSGSNIPDAPRVISDALSAIPQKLLGLTEKQGPPRPPEKVYEMWVRPGFTVWEGKISRSQPSPWFEAKETVFAFIDTDGEGVQRKEFFPGNPHIFRWVEDESDEPLTAAAFGEQVP